MKNNLKKNTFIYGVRQGIIFILFLFVNLFTTKKLDVADFGIFAIYYSIVGIFGFLTDGSVWVGFIQAQDKISESFINKMCTLVLLVIFVFAFFLILIVNIFSINIFLQYHILYFALAVVLLTSIQGVIYTKFQKELYISYIAIIDLISNITYYILVVLLVVLNFGLYGLLISLMIKSMIGIMITLIFYKRRIGFNFAFTDRIFRRNLKNGLINILSFPISYFRSIMNPLVVGSFCGVGAVGIVDRAVMLAGIPSNIMTVAIQKVLFPSFSKSINNGMDVKNTIKKVVFYSSFLDKLFYLPLMLLISPAVKYFLGEKWKDLVMPVYILSFGNMIFGGLSSVLSVCILSLGLFKKNFLLNLMQIMITFPLSLLLCYFSGINGYVAVSPITWLLTYYYLYIVKHSLGSFTIFYEYFSSVLFSIPIGAIVLLFQTRMEFKNLLLEILFVVTTFSLLYITGFILIDKKYLRRNIYDFIVLWLRRNDNKYNK
jgi:O-antigen/teichoic acid export membrane protein